MSDTIKETHIALNALAAAWRGDWSLFDGRTLRDQLGEIGEVLDGKLTAEQFCQMREICVNGCGWLGYCDCPAANTDRNQDQ